MPGSPLAIGRCLAYVFVMPSMTVAGRPIHYEAPEAGRYHAPLLVLPGLFQSFDCWRTVTTMLAHRGWQVYCVARTMPNSDGDSVTPDAGWDETRTAALEIARELDEKVILLGSDLGCSLALNIAQEVDVMAMALFSPAEPSLIGKNFMACLGMMGRRAYKRSGPAVDAPAAVRDRELHPDYLLAEPKRLLDELPNVKPVGRPSTLPPSILFASANDPLVGRDDALGLVGDDCKASPTGLDGHWWPLVGSQSLADEVHRFLILTLADRVVDFPDEVFGDDEPDDD